jgi:hypothetical protein
MVLRQRRNRVRQRAILHDAEHRLRSAAADGTLCYSIEKTSDPGGACEFSSFVWKNGTGIVIARGFIGRSQSTTPTMATCEATGETCSAVSQAVPARKGETCVPDETVWPASGKSCTEGTCP